MDGRKKIQTTNIRFNLDDEQHRLAWQLLQDRDKERFSSYSQVVINALIELLKEPETDDMSPELVLREVYLPRICEAVEQTVEKTIERSLPLFLAGYMSCIGSMQSVRTSTVRLPEKTEPAEKEGTSEEDIDFGFLGLD